MVFSRPFGTFLSLESQPDVETLGYYQTSLRDARAPQASNYCSHLRGWRYVFLLLLPALALALTGCGTFDKPTAAKFASVIIEGHTPAQIRDAALAATVQLNGQNPKDFGFERFQATDRVQLNAVMIAFRNDKERSAAFEKWQTWQNGQKQAAREKVEPKTSIE
jgi:hypothetical protein